MDGSLLAALKKRRASQRTTSLPYGDTSDCSAILHACIGKMWSLKIAAMCQYVTRLSQPAQKLGCGAFHPCLLQSNACPGAYPQDMHKPHVPVWQADFSQFACCHFWRLVCDLT